MKEITPRKSKTCATYLGPGPPSELPGSGNFYWLPSHLAGTVAKKFLFSGFTFISVLLLVDMAEVIFKAVIIPVGRAPPAEKHRKPTTVSRLRLVQWRIMPVPLW
jgi:hypothetical protein